MGKVKVMMLLPVEVSIEVDDDLLNQAEKLRDQIEKTNYSDRRVRDVIESDSEEIEQQIWDIVKKGAEAVRSSDFIDSIQILLNYSYGSYYCEL